MGHDELTTYQLLRPPPLPRQIADQIRARIHAEEPGYRTHDQLPSMQALADQLGVSRTTVRNACVLLVQDGHIQVVTGRGAFVLPPRFWRR